MRPSSFMKTRRASFRKSDDDPSARRPTTTSRACCRAWKLVLSRTAHRRHSTMKNLSAGKFDPARLSRTALLAYKFIYLLLARREMLLPARSTGCIRVIWIRPTGNARRVIAITHAEEKRSAGCHGVGKYLFVTFAPISNNRYRQVYLPIRANTNVSR